MKKRQEKFSSPWKTFASRWQYYTPPGRPSKQVIKIYKEFSLKVISKKRKPFALVLGATPELRDLLFKLKIKRAMIDLSLEMILAMTNLRRYKDQKEIILKANWLENPLSSNLFDLILGDIVLPNIPFSKQKNLLKEIKRLLKPKGCLIIRHYLIPDDFQFFSFEEILQKFKSLPFYKNESMEVFAYFLNTVWNPRSKIAKAREIKKRLKKYWKKNRFVFPHKTLERVLNGIWMMWQPFDKTWATDWERNVFKQMEPYFKILKKTVLSDCRFSEINKSFPIWLCQVKK